ncbi:MAG: energy-coupling factor transporter ATPase [Tissierellales bacterium]|jgi:energy-coupling factor transport system ATP-binding protein|nr:energy-coupling factor transporter ATPase [Tissierellales bacterium]
MSIEINDLNFIYNEGTPFERQALKNINLEISDSELVGLIGHTGSGKSTLIQHFNGLLKPTSGTILVDGEDLFKEKKTLLNIRKKIGLVFQYPEHQLFEETIGKDIAFGPTNLGLNEDEVNSRVRESMELVGLDYETMVDRSPFELSGGQKRRVAIAGVLAMNPSVLILDEPTAGLDPRGRDEIFNQIKELYDKKKLTIIIVSHSMEDMANLVNRLVVMYHGEVYMSGKPKEIFERAEELEKIGLGVPQIKKLMIKLKSLGKIKDDSAITIEEAKKIIIDELRS